MKYKVMYLITGLNAGGAENMVYKLTKHHSQEVTPVVVSLLPKGPVSKKIISSGIKVYHLNMKNGKNIFGAFFRLLKIIKHEKPEIIHNFLFHADVFGRLSKFFNPNIKIITSIRNENIGGKHREVFMRLTDFLCDRVTSVCQTAADEQLKSKSIRRSKLNVVYNGIEIEKYKDPSLREYRMLRQSLNINMNDIVLITVGRLDSQKNHKKLINTFQKITTLHNNLKLLIVGEGRLRAELENQAVRLGVQDRVVFTGLRDDVPKLLSVSDVFVLSSDWEGLPNVVLEAMAAKLPVLSTDVGGASEVIINNKTGYLVDKDDTQNFYKKMKELVELTNEERIAMGIKGRLHVEKNYTISKTVIKMENLYKKLLSIQ